MLNDPIVHAVHQIRESIARSFNYDVKAIFADMRTRETHVGNRLEDRKGVRNQRQVLVSGFWVSCGRLAGRRQPVLTKERRRDQRQNFFSLKG